MQRKSDDEMVLSLQQQVSSLTPTLPWSQQIRGKAPSVYGYVDAAIFFFVCIHQTPHHLYEIEAPDCIYRLQDLLVKEAHIP
mmetsp:Transcript_35714/g.57376  ORF Transcript_35714/g.57376 Transcript_35714/m.57376 type:complete len:82 (+) Transcript_35714:251-496(+)